MYNNRKEIVFNFPFSLNKEKKINLSEENFINPDEEIKNKTNRAFSLTEMIRENEWQQEYFLIYNSYVIESA